MRYSLRTLLIFMLLMGPVCALGWVNYQAYREAQEQKQLATKRWVVVRLAKPVFIRNGGWRQISTSEGEALVESLTAKMKEAQRQSQADVELRQAAYDFSVDRIPIDP